MDGRASHPPLPARAQPRGASLGSRPSQDPGRRRDGLAAVRLGDSGEGGGFSNDYARLLAGKVGLELEFIHGLTWNQLLEATRTREIDLLPAIWKTADREVFLAYTRSYHQSPIVLIVRRGVRDLRTFGDIMHLDDVEPIARNNAEALASHVPYSHEYRLYDADGELHWVLARGRAIYDEEDQPIFLDGTIFDVTETQQAEQVLTKAEERGRLLLESAGEDELPPGSVRVSSRLRVPDVRIAAD